MNRKKSARLIDLCKDMKHTLLIDSRDRDAGKPGSYRILLPKMYENVIGARLLTAEIPSTFYIFTASSGNTALYVTLDGQSVPANIILPDGNYGSTEMQNVLVEALNANTALTWSVTTNPTTQKITLSNTELVDFSVDASGLGKYLGFSGVQLSEEGSITSSSIVSLNPHTYILLDIDELNGIDEGIIGGGGAGRGAFCKIPFNANSFEYAMLDAHRGTPRVDVNIARLDRLRIRLRFHEDGEIIDFNGVEHSFTLEITTRDRGDPVQNTAPIIANAASTAAAAAAAAAIAATRSAQSMNAMYDARDAARKKDLEEKSTYRIPKKAYKWIFVALLGLAAAIYLYMKRTRPVEAPVDVTSHFTPTISQRTPMPTSMYQPSASRFGGRPT
jgi:hypothetical protein